MATTYTYSKAVDFPNGLAPGQLADEIRADSALNAKFGYINVSGDVVDIIFGSALTTGELTDLNNIIAAHVPLPTGFIVDVEGYIDLTSTLADGSAITINATDAVGGMAFTANNQISINAGAASNFTTTSGDLTLNSAGIAHLEGSGGIRIGMNNDAQAILIGNSASARMLTIGNQNTTTSVEIESGTGGFSVDSTGTFSIDGNGASSNMTLTTTGDAQDLTIALSGSNDSSIIIDSMGTGADAIRLRTDGGMDFDATGGFNLATGVNSGGAITLDAAFNNGGITISAGNMGVAINSTNGAIAIGTFTPATILIGTSGPNAITIGNINTTSSVAINSGTGGINIGGNSSTGEINIGNTAVAKTLVIGNNTSGSRTFNRYGSGGNYISQPAHTAVSDSDNAISVGALLTGILTGTPTADRTQTLPDASTVVSSISGIQVDDSFDFHFINKSTTDDAEWIIAMGTGGTMEGNPNVSPIENTINSYKNNGSSWFRLRMTNVTASSEAYTVYRLS